MSNNSYNSIVDEVLLKDGKKLILRKPKVEDAENIIEYLNIIGGESDNLLFGCGDFNLTIKQEQEYIESLNKDNNCLMLVGIIDNQIVSVAQISSSNRKRIAHNSEIAISVKKSYWRNGVGSAVMKDLIRFVKEDDTIRNISLGVKASNKNAIMLYEKFGFQKVGSHKNYFNVNGVFDDEILMDLYI